jgi:hypothetical protein
MMGKSLMVKSGNSDSLHPVVGGNLCVFRCHRRAGSVVQVASCR